MCKSNCMQTATSTQMLDFLFSVFTRENRADAFKNDESIVYEATKAGSLVLLKHLIANECPVGQDVLRVACLYGSAQVVKFLLQRDGITLSRSDLLLSCASATLEVVQYLFDYGKHDPLFDDPELMVRCMTESIRKCRIDICGYLLTTKLLSAMSAKQFALGKQMVSRLIDEGHKEEFSRLLKNAKCD